MQRGLDLPNWVWRYTLIAVGLCLSIIHLYHLTHENATIALAIGVVIPLGISLAVIGVGIVSFQQSQLQEFGPWMTAWMLLAMVWMAIAGTGAVLYEYAEGVGLSHAYFIIMIFATYGCLPGLLTGWYDGHRRQQLRTIETREEQLTVLSRILRHDLRNAMNVILGRAESIQSAESGETADNAAAIIESGRELMRLTEKERNLVDALVGPSERIVLNLDTILRGVINNLTDEYSQVDISVKNHPTYRVRAVPEIEWALLEILENAIVHNEAEKPEVSIHVEKKNRLIILAISDNGPGIPPEEIALLTGEESKSQLNHGNGIGLQLSDTIIDQSDGALEIRSAHSEGTKVQILLPAA